MSTYLRGGFDWHLSFFWEWLPPKDRARRLRDPTAEFKTPAIAGGLFAINRDWFLELGTYDTGMDNTLKKQYTQCTSISLITGMPPLKMLFKWGCRRIAAYYFTLYIVGMDIWGGENIELSWRIWMCGGEMEIVPCSKVNSWLLLWLLRRRLSTKRGLLNKVNCNRSLPNVFP